MSKEFPQDLYYLDREMRRMYFVSMSGVCDVWVGEKGEVKRLEREEEV